MISSRMALVNLVPKRAMANLAKSSNDGTSKGDKEETQVTKKEQSTGKFINYSHRPGFKSDPNTWETYYNPLLTPPPRSPSTPEDFRHPARLGHWKPLGFDYTSPVADKYYFHEYIFAFVVGTTLTLWLFRYGPDYKYKEWSKREAFLRTAKREALGLPLIDRDVVPRERVVLPTEEELEDFPVTL